MKLSKGRRSDITPESQAVFNTAMELVSQFDSKREAYYVEQKRKEQEEAEYSRRIDELVLFAQQEATKVISQLSDAAFEYPSHPMDSPEVKSTYDEYSKNVDAKANELGVDRINALPYFLTRYRGRNDFIRTKVEREEKKAKFKDAYSKAQNSKSPFKPPMVEESTFTPPEKPTEPPSNERFTINDVGCYADGANGDAHLRTVLADLVGSFPDHSPLLIRDLEGESSDDGAEINDAISFLQDHTDDGLMWELEAGDLCLRVYVEESTNEATSFPPPPKPPKPKLPKPVWEDDPVNPEARRTDQFVEEFDDNEYNRFVRVLLYRERAEDSDSVSPRYGQYVGNQVWFITFDNGYYSGNYYVSTIEEGGITGLILYGGDERGSAISYSCMRNIMRWVKQKKQEFRNARNSVETNEATSFPPPEHPDIVKAREEEERTRRYEEERAREREVQVQAFNKMKEVLIAAGFTPETNTSETDNSISGENADGEGIWLRTDNPYRPTRIEIAGEYPRDRSGGYVQVSRVDPRDSRGWTTSWGGPRISVSINKSTPQIVNDINRRFMPAYRERLKAVRDKIEQMNQYEDLTLNTLKSLSNKELDNYDTRNSMFRFDGAGNVYGTVKVNGDRVEIELHSLNPTQAKAVLDFLQKKEFEGQNESTEEVPTELQIEDLTHEEAIEILNLLK